MNKTKNPLIKSSGLVSNPIIAWNFSSKYGFIGGNERR